MAKGFTLVELLAVIVILAVLALIATPVVLSIIDDAKESAMLRSAEMYLSGVENAVMRENMNSGGNFRPNECTITDGNMICGATTVKVEVDGEVPGTGSIVFENGKITSVTLNYESGTIVKDASGNLVYEGSESSKTIDTICTYDSTNGVAAKTAGARYTCEVKPGTSYNFYVLTTPKEGDATINLIMDQNINSDGTPAGITGTTQTSDPSKYNLVPWVSKDDYKNNGGFNVENLTDGGTCEFGDLTCEMNELGPITAMQFLYNATKDWTNIEPLNYAYNDKEIQGTTQENTSYISFVSTNGVSTITSLYGNEFIIGTISEPLRARMLIYSSDENVTEVKSNANAEYLYNNLSPDGISFPWGYWTLSSVSTDSSRSIAILFDGRIGNIYSQRDGRHGVRPVITLKI